MTDAEHHLVQLMRCCWTRAKAAPAKSFDRSLALRDLRKYQEQGQV